MSENNTKTYIEKVSELFSDDSSFHNLVDSINNGRTSFTISQKFLKKEFDNEWIDIIEEILPSIDAIVRNPRRFITIEASGLFRVHGRWFRSPHLPPLEGADC